MKKSLKSVCKLNTYKQIDAATIMDLIEESTDIALLPSSKNYNIYTSLEKGKSLMSNGEVITLGKARYANIKYYKGNFISSNNVIIESKDTSFLRTKYLYYYLYFTQKNYYVEGATYPKFDQNLFNNSIIDIPTIQQQDKTIILLDYLFNFIEQESIYVEKFEELIKSRFIEMFGDPISNDKNWEFIPITNVCKNILGGGTPSKSKPEYYNGNIPWVTPKDMKHTIISDSIDHITEDAIKNSSTNLIETNSILMVVRSGILKHTLPVAINEIPVTINQDMKAFIPNKKVTTRYLLYYFKIIENDVLSGVRSVTADNIDFKTFQKRKIIIPPIELQNKFAEFVQLIDKLKFIAQKRIDLYTELLNKKMDEYFN